MTHDHSGPCRCPKFNQPQPNPPLSIIHDELTDTVKIEGVVYAAQLFRELGSEGFPVGAVFRIAQRAPGGVLVLERITMSDRRVD